MTPSLKPYPAYKDSGVPWLGEVPAHWGVQRAKTTFHERDERRGDGTGVLLSLTRNRGILPHSEATDRLPGAEDLSMYKVCGAGDLVMNRMQAWSGMFALSPMEGVVSPDYSVFRAVGSHNVKYFELLFRTPLVVAQFARLSKGIGSGFNRLYTEDFGGVLVAVPPVDEQASIVRYLDHADRKVRHAIRARQRLVKLLTEQKQAIIQRAVTRGLDPNVRLKPSGVPWLGDVPEHWEVARLKQLCRFSYGDSLPTEIRQDGGIPVFGSNGCVGLHSVANTHAPCIVIGRKGSFGKIHFSETPVFAIDTTYFVDDRCTHANLHWLAYLLASLRLDGVSKDSAVPGLDRGDAYDQVAAYPVDTSEQVSIVRYLDAATANLDKAIDAARREIDLLREYRTRLIADVVTGKLDVRDAATHLPDELEEQSEPLDEEPADDAADLESEEEGNGEQTES